jgi:hypothetical protein
VKLDALKDLLASAYIGAASAGAAVRAVETVTPASSTWWAVVVLGVPLSVLAAALVGASIRAFREGVQPDRKMPHHAIGVTFDGFVGGWIAMFIVGFSYTHVHVQDIAPEILGGFGGLSTEFVRTNGKRWFEQLYSAVLSRVKKQPAGDLPE